MLILGIETSCDETGVALYDAAAGRLAAHAVHSQVAMHEAYGGVVPELASRDHIRRLIPLTRQVLGQAKRDIHDLKAIGYTEGPGLAGALLVGASFAHALGLALRIPALGIHHLEGHLLSPLLSERRAAFPFVALLVSGGHTQLMQVDGVGRTPCSARHRTTPRAKPSTRPRSSSASAIPAGRRCRSSPTRAVPGRVSLPRPMLHSGDLEFSFSGLKTAVATAMRNEQPRPADLARAFVDAVVEVLVAKCLQALQATRSEATGGRRRRRRKPPAARGARCRGQAARLRGVLPGARAVHRQRRDDRVRRGACACRSRRATKRGFSVKPRWDLQG